MTNLQVLEKLRARLLKQIAKTENDAWVEPNQEARYMTLCIVTGMEMSVEILDELLKELET